MMQWLELSLNKLTRRRFTRKVNRNRNLLAQKIWSSDFFTFVIMQVVLLNICLGQR